MRSVPELLFAKHLKELGVKFEREVRFHPVRRWRFDFVLTDYRIAVEICGSIWKGRAGGHSSGFGLQRDFDKRNAGVMLGYRILTFSSRDVLYGRAKAFLVEHLGKKAA